MHGSHLGLISGKDKDLIMICLKKKLAISEGDDVFNIEEVDYNLTERELKIFRALYRLEKLFADYKKNEGSRIMLYGSGELTARIINNDIHGKEHLFIREGANSYGCHAIVESYLIPCDGGDGGDI